MACATSSLPTPLSPVMSTLASDLAIRSISSDSSIIGALSPIRFPFPCALIGFRPRGDWSFACAFQKLLEAFLVSIIEVHEDRAERSSRYGWVRSPTAHVEAGRQWPAGRRGQQPAARTDGK